MRTAPKSRYMRYLRNTDRYLVFAAIGVLLFVLFANSLAASIESGIVASAKARASTSPEEKDASAITSARINTRTLGENGLEHARDVMRGLWPHLSRFPTLQARSTALAYLLGSATLPGLSAEQTNAHVLEMASTVNDMPTLMSLTGTVSLADGKADVKHALQARLSRQVPSDDVHSGWFDDALTAYVSEDGPAWPESVDVLLLARYKRAMGATGGSGGGGGDCPPLAEHLELYEALLVAWQLGGRRNAELLAAYQKGVQALLWQRVRTQAATNVTIVGASAALGPAEHVSATLTAASCEVATLLAKGVRAGAHPVRLARSGSSHDAAHVPQLTEQAVLDAAESLAASCVVLAWHGVPTHAAGYLAAEASRAFTMPTLASEHALLQGMAATGGLTCQRAGEMMRMLYELYVTTKDVLYAVWALRAFSTSSTECQPTAGALSAGVGPALTTFMDEFRYFSYLTHAAYCGHHLPVKQEKALCAFHQRTTLWRNEYVLVLPAN